MITQTRRSAGDDESRSFEWSLLIAVAGLIVGALLAALHDARERAEPVLVELTIRSMQSALHWAVGEAIMEQREADLKSFAGANPVRWLQAPPPGYRGECPAGGKPLLPGDWCFASRRGELIYRPYHREALQGAAPQACNELAWRVATSPESPRAGAGLRIIPASACRLSER